MVSWRSINVKIHIFPPLCLQPNPIHIKTLEFGENWIYCVLGKTNIKGECAIFQLCCLLFNFSHPQFPMFNIIHIIKIYISFQLRCPLFNFTHPQFPIFTIDEVSDGTDTVGVLRIKKRNEYQIYHLHCETTP